MKKYLKIFFIILLITQACSGGDGNKINPEITPPQNQDLSELAVNTFIENGYDITVNPTYIEMGETNQYEPLTATFNLENNTNNTQKFTIDIYGTSGGFRLIDENGLVFAHLTDIILRPGESKEFTLQFDASLVGKRQNYLEITAMNIEGYIQLPFSAHVVGPGDFSIIPSSKMCSGENDPLSQIDFMKMASGRTKTMSFKVCNVGGEDMQVYSLTVNEPVNDSLSESLTPDVFEDFNWDVENEIISDLANYYSPDTVENFDEPIFVNYTGDEKPNFETAFRIEEQTLGVDPKNILVPSGSYAKFDVDFTPTLNSEAPEGSLFEPIPYAASLLIKTSLGDYTVDLLGSTGGIEPVLELTYNIDGGEEKTVDLDSEGAAIDFEEASIFSDWITEDKQIATLTFRNVGSGDKILEIWMDKMDTGYFTFVEDSENPIVFPIRLATGREKTLQMMYVPTPETISDTFDLGQNIIKHTGGNGPKNRLTLVGEQKTDLAAQVFLGSLKLKQNYPQETPKSFCVFQMGIGSQKEFKIVNASGLEGNTLTSKINVTMDDGNAEISQSTITTNPKSESSFTINFIPPSNANSGDRITGTLTIENSFELEDEFQIKLNPYTINFYALASEDGVCNGGDGTPAQGNATLLVDRFTMILGGGGVAEATRSLPSKKIHVPLTLNPTEGYAVMGSMPYDHTNPTVEPHKIFRAYAHQLTQVVGSCLPMSTNPYRNEFEEGSFDGDVQCPYEDENFSVKGSEVCLAENAAQPYSENGQNYSVFYHEFIKFEPGTCNVMFKGKIATFYLKEGQTIQQRFQEIEQNVGTNGSLEQYRSEGRMFQFDSYIQFDQPYTSKKQDGTCTKEAQTSLTDPDEIANCWEEFAEDTQLSRPFGMYEECSYFNFIIHPGCVPGSDACNSDANDPETWNGYGPLTVDEEDPTKWNMTLHNIHFEVFVVSTSLNGFFANAGKLLYSELYSTFTTQAVGQDINNANWDELVALNIRPDIDKDLIYIKLDSDDAKNYWMEDGMNSELTTSVNDINDCSTQEPLTSCKGVYQITSDKEYLMHAGEPIDFENFGRMLLVGVSAFHGKGQLAPSFAAEDPNDGTGQPLYFSIQGCVRDSEEGEELPADAGCYDTHQDFIEGSDVDIINEYIAADILEKEDDEKSFINFKIFNEDRNRYTNYFDSPNNYYFDVDYFNSQSTCGGRGQ